MRKWDAGDAGRGPFPGNAERPRPCASILDQEEPRSEPSERQEGEALAPALVRGLQVVVDEEEEIAPPPPPEGERRQQREGEEFPDDAGIPPSAQAARQDQMRKHEGKLAGQETDWRHGGTDQAPAGDPGGLTQADVGAMRITPAPEPSAQSGHCMA